MQIDGRCFMLILSFDFLTKRLDLVLIREFKKSTTATATGTSLNKRFNEQNNGCAHAF